MEQQKLKKSIFKDLAAEYINVNIIFTKVAISCGHIKKKYKNVANV